MTSIITNVTLRFNFTDDIMAMIMRFAKLHRFDDRRTYKEHWVKWVEEHKNIILIEGERLTAAGYKGETIEEKMFKAGRYYFRKKKNGGEKNGDEKNGEEKNGGEKNVEANNKPRTYITMDKRIIEEMDKHIISSIRRQQANCLHYIPAKGYEEFCKLYENLLINEQKRLILEYNIDEDTISTKIKKNYKNRYFIITS
jgi:hypothetical protein